MSPQLTRQQFLRLAAAALPALAAGRTLRLSAQDLEGDRRERIADTIRMYQMQGSHRTATDVDNDSAEWLVSEASQLGADATARRFTLNRIELDDCYVEAAGTRREGLPFFDGGFTRDNGVSGVLGAPGSGAPIVLVTLDSAAISSEGQSIATLRRTPGISAIVAVTRGGQPGLCPSNARAFQQPFGAPVLQVSSTAGDWLADVARTRTPLRVVAAATRERAPADNVLATVHGRRPELSPVVVMTPRSGWWQCASERGGGIACWIEIMRAVTDVRPDRTVRFIASSGHELGHLGLETFLREEATLIKSAAAWLHLGANIGAADGSLRLQSSSDEIEAIAVAALQKADARLDGRLARGTVPGGEARNIHVAGGRYVSLLGSGPHFHNPDDLWPTSVDLAALDRYAAATVEITLQLARA